eukprot:6505440-Alexandrium_andersonii.AAC.1
MARAGQARGMQSRNPVEAACIPWPGQHGLQPFREGMIALDPRSVLFYDVVRLAKGAKVPWVFLENVYGLMSERMEGVFKTVLTSLVKAACAFK